MGLVGLPAVAGDAASPEDDRIAATRLVGYGARQNPKDRDLLVRLLRPQESIGLQAAVAALATTADPKLADVLLVDWKKFSPLIKTAVFGHAALTHGVDVVVAVASKTVVSHPRKSTPPGASSSSRAEVIRFVRRPLAVFAHQSQPRQAVVDAYQEALVGQGDQIAGAAVFKKSCTSCHRMGTEGTEVGPDLAAINDRSPQSLLIAILDPNRLRSKIR